jgi:hypothetical protein
MSEIFVNFRVFPVMISDLILSLLSGNRQFFFELQNIIVAILIVVN